MPRLVSSWPLLLGFLLALLVMPFYLVGTPADVVSSALAEEDEAEDDGEEIGPGPDLGDQDVPFHEQVNKAIDDGVRWLKARPKVDEIPGSDGMRGAHWGLVKGSEFYGGGDGAAYRHPAGPTALALYTLLKCGVSPKDPIIERGFDWLRSFHQVTEEWDGVAIPKVRHWTHTVAVSSYELSVMILALTAKYDPYKKSARTQAARRKGRLKIKNKGDRWWLQQMVTALVERRGQPTKEAIKLDKSWLKRLANPEKEEPTPKPAGELPPKAERLGWRYNVPQLNLVHVRKSGKSSSTDSWGRGVNVPPHANQDLSSTQLAALALYSAMQFGAKFDPSVWVDIAEFTLSHQEEDGPDHKRHDPILAGGGYAVPTDKARGFVYIKGSPDRTEGVATGSMTACGIANLLMVKDALATMKKGAKLWQKAELDSRIGKSVWDGLAWLDRNWSAFRNPKAGTYHIYYLYAVERAQDLRGKELVGKHLWYREGAREILKRQKRVKVSDPLDSRAPEVEAVFWNTNASHDPKDVLDTCFALLFLKRATKQMIGAPITPPDSGPPVDNR